MADDRELMDGLTYMYGTLDALRVVNIFKDMGITPQNLRQTYAEEIDSVWRNKAEQLKDQSKTIEVNVAGYRELVVLRDSCASEKPKPGFIYLITDGQAVKIGQAVNVEKRLANHQCSNPRKLVLLQTIEVDDMTQAERSLQAWYAPFWIRGEWYNLLPLFGLCDADMIERALGASNVEHKFTYVVSVNDGTRPINEVIWSNRSLEQ